jgi:hypothetical protein
MRERINTWKIAVIGACVAVNLWGVLAFNRFDWVI